MKKLHVKSIATLALAGILATSPVAALAASYSDVPNTHWAYTHISRLSDLKIVDGYVDGSFKPDRAVSYLEILELLKGVQKPTGAEISEALAKQGYIADAYKVPQWAKSAVSYALNTGLLTETNLKAAYARGWVTSQPTADQYPNREVALVLYAKALGMKPSNDLSSIKVSDLDAIGKTAKELIGDVDVKGLYAAMVDAKIFDALGDEGQFRPQDTLKREQMAKITDLSYQYKAAQENTREYEGKVIYHERLNNTNTFAIATKDKKTVGFVLNDKTQVTVNGKAADADAIVEGSTVKVSAYMEEGAITALTAKTVEVVKADVKTIGIVQSVEKDGLKISYTLKDNIDPSHEFDMEKTEVFSFADNAKITRHGAEIKASDIRKDDMVAFTTENGRLKEIAVYPKTHSVEGTVVDIDYGTMQGKRQAVKVKLSEDNAFTYYVLEPEIIEKINTLIKDNDRNVKLRFNLLYQNIVGVEKYTSKGMVQGTFKGYDTGFTNSTWDFAIKLSNENGEKRYVLADKIEYVDESLGGASGTYTAWELHNILKNKNNAFLDVYMVNDRVVKIVLRGYVQEPGKEVQIKIDRLMIDTSGWGKNAMPGYTAYEFTMLDSNDVDNTFRGRFQSTQKYTIGTILTMKADVMRRDGEIYYINATVNGVPALPINAGL